MELLEILSIIIKSAIKVGDYKCILEVAKIMADKRIFDLPDYQNNGDS